MHVTTGLRDSHVQAAHLHAGSAVLVGVQGTVAALLAAVRVAALPAADLGAAEGAAFATLTLSVQAARRAAHL